MKDWANGRAGGGPGVTSATTAAPAPTGLPGTPAEDRSTPPAVVPRPAHETPRDWAETATYALPRSSAHMATREEEMDRQHAIGLGFGWERGDWFKLRDSEVSPPDFSDKPGPVASTWSTCRATSHWWPCRTATSGSCTAAGWGPSSRRASWPAGSPRATRWTWSSTRSTSP